MKKFILLFLLLPNLLFAETILIQGVEFTVEKESETMKRWRLGNDTFLIKDGQAIPAKKVKAYEFIPTGEILPLQAVEDLDGDGFTDYVYVNLNTNIQVVKKDEPKDTMYAGPTN